ncbi:dihydropteroate synthase [Chloroflexota bacterium]
MITTLVGKTTKVEISREKPTVIIGERINPVGKPRFAEALIKGNWDLVRREAISQVDKGAMVIDINVGATGVDETATLPQAVKVVSEAVGVPLSLDSTNPMALEAALKVCPGKALINSTTGEEKALATILPLAKEHGAAVIALCHDEEGIAKDAEKRFQVAQKIITRARDFGVEETDILLDPMVLPVGVDAQAGAVCLTTAYLISERLGLNLTIGASNMSFGLPDRHLINNTFLVMAIWCGVNAPIVNPANKGLIEAILTADMIAGKDSYCTRYIKQYRKSHQG